MDVSVGVDVDVRVRVRKGESECLYNQLEEKEKNNKK